MEMEDDISVEVLPSSGEIKIHLPLCYQIHQILCLHSTKKPPNKPEQLLNAVPHKRLILQSNWGVPRTMTGSQLQAVVSDLSKGVQL